uniref:Uncharacterized protein n=1 Tax=Panagrolaimus superbus TaxID=310955 RepID=A0A914Y9L4_9BILA
MNGLPNTGLNPYNSYQNGYGSLYPTTMGTGLPGMNGYPYANGINNVMNPYYGQQFGYNGNPFTGQLQYPGYPINGNSGSNSQASASSKSF